MSYIVRIIKYKPIIVWVMIVNFAVFLSCNRPDNQDFYQQTLEESVTPVHPGKPGSIPFWNRYSIRFMYAPAFDFKKIDGAAKYLFTIISASNKKSYTFHSDKPWNPLSPVWKEIPVGIAYLKVEGLDENDKIIGFSGERKFYRASVFSGVKNEPAVGYKECAFKGMQFLFRKSYVKNWLETGKPDTSYYLYCYPAKMHSAVINSMLLFANMAEPLDSAVAIQIAVKAADYLIGLSEPADKPLAYFPPTYDVDFANRVSNQGNIAIIEAKKRASTYHDQIMLNYPASAAGTFLKLYKITGDKKYFEQAVNIADTYVKLQLPNGTWYNKINKNTGLPAQQNELVPMGPVSLFTRLTDQFNLEEYSEPRDRAVEWIRTNRLKDYYWEGQFEDVPLLEEKYKNMTRGDACSFARYLLDHPVDGINCVETAEELIRYAEDQFVVWEKPLPSDEFPDWFAKPWIIPSDSWLTPSTLEQYEYYVPVSASASAMVSVFCKAFEHTGKEIYLAKAKYLANMVTIVQNPITGELPTYWNIEELRQGAWLNCMVADAGAMLTIAKYLE